MTDRILYTIPNLDTAGSGKALANLVEHLDRDRFEPIVVVNRAADTPTSRWFRAMGVPVLTEAVTLPPRPRATLPWRALRRGRELRRLDAAIWHSFHYLDDYTEPLIARAAGARWVCQKKNMSWNQRSWRLRTSLAHAVAAQNTDMLRLFFPGRRGRRSHLVPPGVPIPERDSIVAAPEFRRRHGLPDDAPLVSCIARIQPLKRQAALVEAMAQVQSAHLVLAGDGDTDSIARIDEIARSLGLQDRVHPLGYIDDVNALMSASSVVCLPTGEVGEGCPVALLEAMALGSAVVTTDIPGSRDVVRPGVDGLMVGPDDVGELARAIRSLIDNADLRRALGEAARIRIIDNYTIEREAQRHEAIYTALLDSP